MPPSSNSPPAAATRRVLVTGVSGQDGYYLAGQLLAQGAVVHGLVRPGSKAGVGGPEAGGEPHGRAGGEPVPSACGAPPGVRLLEGDLRDLASLRRAVEAARPDEVYNLAAATFVPGSFADPGATAEVNVRGVENLVAALADCGSEARFCHASSSEIFAATTGRPCREDDPLAPNTPYGQAKAAAHCFVAEQRERRGLFACSAILFNHESPRRPPRFVTRKITIAAARISRGLQQTLTLGNLDAVRDWGYAPEYMQAMQRMLGAEEARDYVVATGRAATVGDFARLAFAHVGLDWRQHVVQDPELMRGSDATFRVGDPSRIRRDLGWEAGTSLEELVRLMVDADLERLETAAEGG